MEFITGFFSNIVDALSSINFEVILQLFSLAFIVIAGPAIIFILYTLRGDL
ncbi:MAG: photosystem II reaction center protein Ycf12 [Geminocystis sp.]|nr:photosystem II reaction center protein Ycf12 [Geminocystis sp.]HIK38835.1 photosystem II reaction center protein Ycf12 [Geminocystis sp. M7585_C2015_104]MCS7147160.1 photosystem II reaction center protein Ycf12 [Geminocystis sp.]MCX8078615.1 photosystem II reaction center protein Ycf12 [Geminocystis sp.]MDW8116156.1 photosystem II reaction center protein Ycf12 [Geminocystis sp.]